MIHKHPRNPAPRNDDTWKVALPERLRMNAALLKMMINGETRLSRRHLRALAADLLQHASEIEAMQAGHTRSLEVVYQTERRA